jgi:hypothetical protein
MTQPEKVKTPGPAPPGPSASTNTISSLETANKEQSTCQWRVYAQEAHPDLGLVDDAGAVGS